MAAFSPAANRLMLETTVRKNQVAVNPSRLARPAQRPFMDVLKKLFQGRFGMPPERVQPLQGELGGSGRKIIRLSTGGHRAIGILYGVREENHAFLAFTRHFLGHRLPVPE